EIHIAVRGGEVCMNIVAMLRALEGRRIRAENHRLKKRLDVSPGRLGDIISQDYRMRKVCDTILQVADSDAMVLITGESGTGKTLIARLVHEASPRHSAPFVEVNCAALPDTLLESELFGHVKGAFTSAVTGRMGQFQAAEGGTIFLDEISEMPLELQAKLLRVLQEKTFRRVGGVKDISSNATIVVSSNRDLPKEVAEGRFRKDLYYRLAIFPIVIPPLRSEGRCDDILLLADHFIRNSVISPHSNVTGLSAVARQKLLRHDWPGNVRELRNVIGRALMIEKTDRIQPSSILI
ncbi:hypothetical protein LCGC14_2334680, partial [marine sediment metagenome]